MGAAHNFQTFSVPSPCQADRVNDPHDHRNDAGIRIIQHLPGPVALPVHQHRIPDARVGIVERQEILVRLFPFHQHRLHHQQLPVLIIPVADGRHYRSHNFSNDHINSPDIIKESHFESVRRSRTLSKCELM